MTELAEKVIYILKEHYKGGGVTLEAESPFQLLIATILSAQCTDERVNRITKMLFKRYPTPKSLADATFEEVSEIIKPLGFYNQKAKYIVGAAKKIVNDYNGEVPNKRESLQAIPGVGRKTANIVLSRIFKTPAIAVDTHVKRVATRIFGIKRNLPDQIERELMQLLPEHLWNDVNLTLIFHGRSICKPAKPLCNSCPVSKFCKYYNKKGENL